MQRHIETSEVADFFAPLRLPLRLCAFAPLREYLLIFLPVYFLDIKMHAAAHDFFQRNAGWFVFLWIDLDAGLRAALKLFAALRGEDYETVF